jgi:hypothetical protein
MTQEQRAGVEHDRVFEPSRLHAGKHGSGQAAHDRKRRPDEWLSQGYRASIWKA